MSVSQFRYKAFISYSHADRKHAEWLLKTLEAYKVPKSLIGRHTENGAIPARLAPIFRDRDELPAAHKLTDRLFQALRASEYLIVLCSPRSAQSKLVNREIVEFKKTHGDGRVLCMIIEGTPFADNPDEECFPEALRHSFMADGRKAGLSAEGLAADLRPEGDGKRMALIKIVAGLIGVGLNDIVRREDQRRHKKLTAFIAASILGMAVMGTLTYRAEVAKEEAAKARTIAEDQRAEIQKQLVMNDDLLHYMMIEMYDKLLEHGNLDTLERVTTKVIEALQTRNLEALSIEQFYHYTGAMLRYGQNLDRQGNSERARKIFDQVLKLSRNFYERYPNSFEANVRLQNNLFFTGYLARRQGRFDDAERDYRERLALNKSAYKRRHNLTFMETTHIGRPPVWDATMSDSLRGLANILAGPRKKPEEALPLLLSSIDILEGLKPEERHPIGYIYDLGSSYYYAADTHLLLGQFDEAEKLFSKRQGIFEKLVAENPKNFRAFRRILTSKEPLARIAQFRGDHAKAYTLRQEIADGFDQLTQKDPSNTLWLGDSAKAQINLAQSAFLLRDMETATAYLQKAKLQISEALERDNTRPQRWLTHHRAQSLEAEIDHAKGDTNASQQKLVALLAELEQKDTAYLTMAGTKEHLADTRLFYGQLLADNGNEQAAKTQWQQLVDLLENSSSSIDLVGKETLSVAYSLLGEQDRALALAQELDRYGYQRSNLLSHNRVSQR